MAETTLKTRFLHAYKTEAQWKALTTVPKSGEILYTKTGERDGWYKVGNGTDLWKDLPYIKPSYDYSEIQPLMSKHYENVYVTANNDPNGYIYFGVVKPTDYYAPWRITYRVNAKINGVTDGYEYSEVTIDGAKDTYYSYRTYNVIPNTSYRPYYYHLLRYAKQAGQLNGYGHQLGLRFHSSYDPSNETHSRIIDIEIIELVNCTFEFRDTMITYADVPGIGSTNYGGVSQFDATTNGQTIAGDRNTYNQLYMSSDRVFAGPNKIFPYTFIMKTDNGRWESIVTSYNSNPVKEHNTHGFRPQQLIYYSGGSTINENAITGTSTFYVSHYAVDTRYSFNTHATAGNEHNLDINKPVYLVGTISPTDELFYLSDPWLAQDLPTEDDGKLYMYVGESINVYQASLHPTHPIYHFKDGKVRQYVIHEATQAVAGLMSAVDKKKLDGIESGANKYTLPVASSSAIGGVKSGGNITVGTDGSVTINEATSLTTDKATSAGNRPVWVSYSGNNKRAAYDTDFTYDAVNNILHVQKIDGVELTGTPKAPTASAGTNSTQIATTAFVQNAVNNAVGDVEVGGRNLIKDSFRTISSTSYALADYYFGDRPPLEGETITIQIKGQLASTKSYFGIYNSGGNIQPSKSSMTAGDQDENGIYTKTFTWFVGSASNKYLRIYHMPSSVSDATSVIEWVKVERGTEPTDWTPAPEELVTSLSVSGRTITYNNYKGETLDSFTTQDTTYTAGTGITISGTTISNAYSDSKVKLSTELNTIALVDAFYETSYFKLGRATNYTTLTDITGRDGIVMSIPWVNTTYAQQVFFDIDDASKIYTRRKNSNGWGSWDRIVTESYGNSTYLPLSGGTLTQVDNVFFTANAGDVLSPLPNSILNSPESKYVWHDVVAFNRVDTPIFYTTTDGTTWTEADLNSEVFSMKQKWGNIIAINSTQAGVRWEWKKNQFSYSEIHWLVIEMNYQSTQAKFDVLLEAGTTTDGTTTYNRVLLDKEGLTGSSFPHYIKITSPNVGSLRLTITKNSNSPANGVLGITGIHLLSNRNTAQGQGREYEYPYKWTGEKNIEFMNSIYPDTNEKYNLGTSTRYWKDIYGKAIYASASSGEVQISVGHSTNQKLYLWGNISSGTRGLYDSKKGYVIQVSDTGATFHGNLNGNANTATTATTAETASFLKRNDSFDYAKSGVSWFDIIGTAGAAVQVNDTPTSAWWHVLRFNHTNTNEYYTDLAVPFNNDHLYYKRISANVVANSRWVQVLDDLNYTSYAIPITGTTINNPNTSSFSLVNAIKGNLIFANTGNTAGDWKGIGGINGSNDAWVLRGYQTANNKGAVELAVGDDGDEGIYVRQYTSAGYKIPLTNKPGANSGLNYREIELMAPSTGATTFPVSVKAPIIMAEEFRTANGGIPAVILCKPGLVSIADTKVDDPETNLTTSMDDDEWLKVLLKKICIEYPGKLNAIFRGGMGPNSQGYYEVYIYNTSAVNANTGLPQYAFGTWRHGSNIYWKFHVWGYTYSSQVILDDENYSTYAVPKSGGTMTGVLNLYPNQTGDEGAIAKTAGTYALNLQNSNIIGVNAIFTSDLADDAREGIHFYHTSTTVDSIWAKNGVLYFTPDRTLGTAGTDNNIILHSDNYMSYAVPYGGDDTGLGAGTPAEKTKEYFLDDSKVPKGTVKVFYNHSGSEFTTIFSRSSSGTYGNILKWGYSDLYLYKLRYGNGSWVANDWQKIYAGYADSAGSATSSVKLGISSDLTNDTLEGFWENGYIKWARIRSYDMGLASKDGLIINIPWNAQHGAQLAIDDTVTRMFMRNRSSNTWGPWHTFAHAQGKTGSTSQPVYMDTDGTLKVTTLTNSDISPIASKTYTGLYGSANDVANASFYFMTVKPTTYYVMWKIRYRIHCWVPGKNYYDSYSDVEIWGYQGSLSTNKIFNAHSYEGSSIRRCYYFHNLYRATQTGVSTYGHLIGLGLRASTNPTDSNYPRTFTIELLETENCECELWDEAVKYASVPGTGSTNYLGLSEINGADNGLQESSDANDTYTVRDYYTYLTAGANGMKQYSLVMEDDTGKWQSFTTTHGTATNKAKNTASFKLGNIYYMSTGNNYNSGQINGANIVTSHAMAIDFRYSTNCGTTLTANKPIFIVGTYNDATNTFTLDNTWWTQDYPTSEDNKIYIKIGYAVNTYQIDFNNTLPMYWYKDGKVRVFVIHEATPVSGGLMSASDKEKLDVLNIAEASMPAGSGKAVGWYRIAKITSASNSIGAGYANFTMYATGGYNSRSPSVGIFELTTMHNFATITQTSALLNQIITKIRLVGSAGEYYVDVYQNSAYTSEQTMGQQTFSFIGRGAIETYNPETPLTGDDANATAASTLEIKNKAMAAENIYTTRMYGNTLIQCDGTIMSGTNSTTTNYTNISNGAIDVYGHTAQSRLLVTHNSTSKSSLYLYANTNNTRGIYTTNSAGTGKTVIGIDDSNNVTLYGNAETATNATTFTASVTVPTSRNYLLFQQDRSSNSGTVNARYHNSLSVTSNVSSSNDGIQWTELWIGNSTASGTAGNSKGWIGLYTSGSNTTHIAAYGTGNSNYFYIPNYAGAGYAVTAAGVSAVGSATKPVYLAANGRVTALDHDVVSAFSYGSDIDANTFYDTGIYNITGGKLTNAPNSYGYGQILTMSYRKLSGNTTPDYASQLYMHHGGNNTNRMFYRTSSQTEWQDWQMVAHGAASTAVGDTNTPVYMTNMGVITAVNQPKSGAWFQGVPYVDANGVIEIGKYIDFHATDTSTADYDVRLTAGTADLTVSKTLKVSGKIHSNGDIYSNGQLYAGVSANTSTKPNGSIHVHDIRKYKVLPSDFDQGANFYFAITDSAVDVTMPTSGVWYSIMHIKGWTGDYSSWELAGPATISDQRTTPLYVRAGRTTDDWGDWRKIYDESNPPAFTEIEGTLGVGKGGTGQTSAKNAANAFLNALDTGSSNPVDADYYISQYVGGGTTTTTYHRRPVSALYNYIKGKTDQVYIPLTGSSSITGHIKTRGTGEVQIGVGYTTEDTARWFYMYGNNTSGTRGIYDSKKGLIVSVTDSAASFKGTADAITNFKVTTSTNLGIASVSTNAIGYVNGLAADDWNYQRTNGALYTQFYSSSWQHEIFGDYCTGQISLRGKNNGTWQAWRRVLDESNYSTIISDNYLQKGGGTITGMVYANADLTVGFSTSTEKSHVTFSNSFNNYELVNTVNGDFALHDNTASHYVWRYAKSSYTQTTNAEITGRLLVDCCLGPTDVIATGYIEAAGNIVTDGGDLISGRTTNSTRASVLLQNNAAGYRLCANTNGHCSLYAPDLGHNIFDFTPNGNSSYIDFPYTVKATVQARSDVRLKENIKDTKVNGLDAVNKMRLREYDWKADHKHQKVGLIADELEKIDEDLVSGGGYLDDGEMNAKCIDSYSLQMYMLKAIQELSQENKQLKEQLKTLMNRG